MRTKDRRRRGGGLPQLGDFAVRQRDLRSAPCARSSRPRALPIREMSMDAATHLHRRPARSRDCGRRVGSPPRPGRPSRRCASTAISLLHRRGQGHAGRHAGAPLQDPLHRAAEAARSRTGSSTSRTAFPASRRFRVNVYFQRDALAAAFRLIPDEAADARGARAAAGLRELAMQPRGLVLVTGPTGSGKSTTLAAMIDEINRQKPRPHPHDRGSDRVRAPAQALRRQPARDRHRRARRSARRCAPRCARTPT